MQNRSGENGIDFCGVASNIATAIYAGDLGGST
jgi:hypothetical protein